MKFAETLYWTVKNHQKAGNHIESIWMTWNTYQLLQKQFLELELGEVSAAGDIPIHKRSWKETKEHKAKTKKEKYQSAVKVLDMTTTLNTLIKLVPPGTVPDGGGPMVKDGTYLLRYSYVGTNSEERMREVKKVKQLNTKMEKEKQEDYGKKIARKVA